MIRMIKLFSNLLKTTTIGRQGVKALFVGLTRQTPCFVLIIASYYTVAKSSSLPAAIVVVNIQRIEGRRADYLR